MRFLHLYQDFTPRQFADDEYFRQWVLAPDETLEQFWAAYQRAYPEQVVLLEAAREIVLAETSGRQDLQPLRTEEKEAMKAAIFNRLNLEAPGEKRLTIPMTRVRLRWTAAAAVVVAISAMYLLKTMPAVREKAVLLAEQTGPAEMKTIVLPDSTVVILNPGSSLQYSSRFDADDNREVWLKGNAFFEVRRSEGIRKFVVHAGSVSATVLGTQLNVDARTPSTEVSLVTGKVRVAIEGGTAPPLYLQPGYKASLDPTQKTLGLTAVDVHLYSAWKDGQWNFSHTSMEDIASLIREFYGVEVIFRRDRTKHQSINAVMAVGSLHKLIPVLEQTLHIKMTLSDNRLVIE